VKVNNQELARAEDYSKKRAEQMAAQKACDALGIGT